MENNWNKIPGFSKYEFNWHTNEIRNSKTGRVLKYIKKRHSLEIFLDKKCLNLGRITLLITQGQKPEGMECLHIDGNYCNNRPENVRYGTHSENMLDRVRHGTHNLKQRKIVEQYSLDGIFIREYKSVRDACDAMRTKSGNLSAACRGQFKTMYGFIWKYKI